MTDITECVWKCCGCGSPPPFRCNCATEVAYTDNKAFKSMWKDELLQKLKNCRSLSTTSATTTWSDAMEDVERWLSESEGHSLKIERLIDDLGNLPAIKGWLAAAYEEGRRVERERWERRSWELDKAWNEAFPARVED